ncbi:MAG TPA: SMP-30/gluconolactonase/LRE family protein [Bryobacteraceae bacterium]|nr:SMP-30/gluconolactonase/LRE family protein [Bryobacteraceae bacterium]
MTRVPFTFVLLFAAAACADDYVLGPDSQPHPGVPHGAMEHFTWTSPRIFPGSVRDYWVYVPAQYDARKPACIMVFQDGSGYAKEDGSWRVPIVFDNLINSGAMPVTIGVFINPGVLPGAGGDEPARFNRSYEYDSVDDRYTRFLTEEILPEVAKKWNISADPNDHAIAGISSGGIAAFTSAMLRPDAFRRVLSFVGSFTDLRGGNVWPDLVRKLEPAPVRIFLQDGNHDLDIFAGSWWMANQDLASALQYAGYDYKFVTGTEGHNGKHGASILPDALRWLWRDWPKSIALAPPAASASGDPHAGFGNVQKIIDPGAGWELVGAGYGFTEGPAVDADGNVFFVDVAKSRVYRVDAQTGKVALFREDAGGTSGLMFDAGERLYAAQNGRRRVVAWSPDGAEKILAEDVGSNDLAVTSRGEIWFTDPAAKKVWFIDSTGNRRAAFEGLNFFNGVRLSPDERMLFVADSSTRWVWSFQIQPGGSLVNGEPFCRLELPLTDDGKAVNAWADGMVFDTDGDLFVATKSGIQIVDQVGRVTGVLRLPPGGAPSNVVLGGPRLDTLYVTAVDKVFRRRVRRQGYLPWKPLKLPKPAL